MFAVSWPEASLVISSLTVALGWVLAVAGTLTAWPQAVRVLRTGRVEGIDVRTVSAAASTMVAWSVFTWAQRDVPAVVSSVGPLTAWLVVLTVLLRARVAGAKRALGVVAAVVALTVAGYQLDLVWLVGIAAAVGSALWVLPQLALARRSHDLRGVSAKAYMLLVIENAGWVLYAVLTSTPMYAVAPLIQAPAASIVAARARRSHRRYASMDAHPSMGVEAA